MILSKWVKGDFVQTVRNAAIPDAISADDTLRPLTQNIRDYCIIKLILFVQSKMSKFEASSKPENEEDLR